VTDEPPHLDRHLDRESFEALPLVQASLRLKPMKKQHAERLAEKMNADTATADVVEAFGPGSEAA